MTTTTELPTTPTLHRDWWDAMSMHARKQLECGCWSGYCRNCEPTFLHLERAEKALREAGEWQ